MTDRPVLITDAPRSYEEQLAARKRRYATLMGGRLALLVLAAIAYPVSVWLAVALLALSVPLPWMAVLIANDAPARKGEDAHRLAVARRPQLQTRGPRAIDAPGRDQWFRSSVRRGSESRSGAGW